jgi:hypothetical protein
LKALAHLCAALMVGSAQSAPTEWLEGTVLADCEYCKTDAFRTERRTIANQVGPKHDPASGMGYIVTMDPDGPLVWGRAALIGTGNLIRTDAHVLFADTLQFKTADGKAYFEPMHHGGVSNLIEIDLSSVQRGGAVGPLETDVKNDWAIARLREDAIEKFDGDRVFAFLWDFRITHDEIVRQGSTRPSALVLSAEHAFRIHQSCQTVTDDHPSHYAFGVEEVFFIRCPSEYVQVGSSGSALAILSPDDTWNLGGQIIGRGTSEQVREGLSGGNGPLAHQLLLGNVPMFRHTLTIVYLQELIRRGIDPRDR